MAVATRAPRSRQYATAMFVTTVVAGVVLPLSLVLGTVVVGALAPWEGGRGNPPMAPPSGTESATPLPTPAVTQRPSPTPSPIPSTSPTTHPTATPTPMPTVAPIPRPTSVPATPPPATPVPATPVPATPAPAPDYSRPGGIYLDILTARRGYGDWYRSVLDTIYMLPAAYHPADMVDTAAAGLNGGYLVRSFVIAHLRDMAAAARAAGVPIAVASGFRSYAQQQATFTYWVSVAGYEQALRTSARPGHSEHQLGTTLDFKSAGGRAPWEYPDWAATPAGGWMAANAWRYGFVMSYPAGRFAETGYDYEPWHYRYVGRELAAAVRASGLPLRQFLWEAR